MTKKKRRVTASPNQAGFKPRCLDKEKKIMKAKVALNMNGLKPRDQLAKYKKAITACGEEPVLADAKPTLVVCLASHDAADSILNQIDTQEGVMVNLRNLRDQTMGVALADHGTLGSCVETASGGDPAFITANGFDVAGSGTPPPPVGQIMNLVLTHGDQDGVVDASWNREKTSRSNEVQISVDPLTPTSWMPCQIATKSSCSIPNLPIGSKVWVRVRAHGKDAPGLWSDPACITVT